MSYFETPLNQKTVTVRIRRKELCDLILACNACSISAKAGDETGAKWDYLRDKLKGVLDAFDAKQGAGEATAE